MNFWDKMLNIDRRYIYLLLAIVVLIPAFFPLGLSLKISPETQSLYNEVDKLAETGKPLFLSLDYTGSTVPELEPMSFAISAHALNKGIPVMFFTMWPDGIGVVGRTLSMIENDFPDKIYGKDYISLGYKPGNVSVMMGIGQNFRSVFPQDSRNGEITDYEITKNIVNYDDIGLVITISGTGIVESWMTYANARYGAKVGTGVTAVMASDYYPYLQTGQFVGLLGGVKGAAEYEQLINRPGNAMKIMESQNFAHLLIILFIVLGNVAFFLSKSGNKKRF